MKGGRRMRKKLSALLVCLVALLTVLMIPAVQATPPEPASGSWTYIVDLIEITKVAGGNTFKYGEETGTWTGTFVGTSFDFFELIVHPSGFVTCQGLIDFTGTVNGESGTMIIKFIGKKTGDPMLWSGTWVIISGTGGLANLHGRGTWEGPSFNLDYSGQIHFEPD
jgi:hypothetical protein